MRRISAVVAVLGLSTLVLAGCSSSDASASPSCDRATSDAAALSLVSVSDDATAPDVSLASEIHVDETVYTDLIVGDGNAVTTPAQDIVFGVTILGGTSGETLIASSTQVASVATWAQTLPGLETALTCATEGSRIVAALAPEDMSADMVTGLGLAEGESAVFVVDLTKVYLAKADGADQYNDRPGMPAVVRAPDGRPGIIVPDADAPDDLVVQVLKKGDGEVVTGDAPVRVHYTGLTWADREVFDSSWENGASVALSLDAVVPGFAAALEGQTVGSQILAVIPPDQGYGDTAQGAIPAGSTLVFVIDILGLDEVAE